MADEKIAYRVVRSDRRTIALQIKDGEVIVRCPRRMREDAIRSFVESKRDWVRKHLEKLEPASELPAFTDEQLRRLARTAAKVIPERVAYFAPLVGVDYGRITIRCQRSRWGSCSSKGNLNFNCLLMLTTPEVVDYVVVHELCHRKQMNHSRDFWAQVERILPDHRQRRKWLKEHGPAIIMRRNAKEG